MLDAAYALFCADGYRATTMEAIAERAGVAVQTLYFTFHTKDELFQEVHERTVVGEENIPPPMQPWYQAAVAAADIVAAVPIMAKGLSTISRRVAPMIPAFHEVSGDPAGEVWARSQQMRYDGMADLLADLTKKAKLRSGLTKATAIDILWVLVGPELYRTFVIDRGWSEKQYETWVGRVLLADLFGLAV
jgi:AcrR family transcriptional regulator